ncbi:type II and III secretion system protein family protein [Novipirellula sp. SH528]|uniref:type II and III secretion system protein family protein n=1 Tax=Novipirellula sp. SH528 TaxID=3454466 RepID=UPI003FA14E7C
MEMNCWTTKSTASLMLMMGLVLTAPMSAAKADGPVQLTSNQSMAAHSISQTVERFEMLVKSSRILTLEDRIPKFQVHNEEVIGATPVSQNQIQIFAKVPGTTQLNLWDTNDKLYTVDVTVLADAREVEGILSSQLPFASLKVMPINDSAIVSGTVTSVDDVDRAVSIVEQFYSTVVNNIKVVGVQQVLLHTKIMEISRTKFRDLGIDLAILDSGNLFVNAPGGLINASASTIAGGVVHSTDQANASVLTGDFRALIKALRQDDLVKLLAEPTVVATHGRPARFIVGGKVPYIVPSGNGAVSVRYEEYGTSVDFLPFVVGPGRIRLEVRPEVSEVDASRSIINDSTQVFAFTHRYVETAIELQAGQTFALAGLLQTRTESTRQATPFFGELPYIGTFFRRVKERRNDIELLVTVTPEVVAAMDPCEAPTGGPGLNSMSPNDKEFYLRGFLEVPNMKGDNCGEEINGYNGVQGFSAAPAYGGQFLGGNPNGFDQEILGNPSIPQGAIVPSATPTVIGDGVTVMSPQN